MNAEAEEPRLIVGVGASAGGLDALKQLLAALPSDSGMAFLLVQHLDPTHRSLLTELLVPCTAMAVAEAAHDVQLAPDTVHIIASDTALAVSGGRIELTAPTLDRGVRLPVDHLFRSLARDCGPRAVGIVLSGAGSDGSAGLRDLKDAGGLTIAQDPASSAQRGMPQSAIDAGVVDLVLEIEEMPAALQRFAHLSERTRAAIAVDGDPERTEQLSSLGQEELGRLAALLEARLDFDLRVYKPATIERRVLRRMTLSGFDDIAGYYEHLRHDDRERQTLVRDLLIGVTEFFRDPEAFRTLREQVIDPMVSEATAGTTLRAWVPGCATGEEAYSIAIEFLEAIGRQNPRVKLQLFATDVDQGALAFGRTGAYPLAIVEHVSDKRLETYFKLLDGRGYRVRPALRDVLSFAAHDLTRDPPFSQMNLVSCRNVLIYLTPEAQRHVLGTLHFALVPEGCLFLSTSESTGQQRDLFSPISKAHRIYKKTGSSHPIGVTRSRSQSPRQRGTGRTGSGEEQHESGRSPVDDAALRAVLEAWTPPTVVVSRDGAILFMHGELAPYLRFPQGHDPRLELGPLLRSEIATRTRGALYKCRRLQESVVALSSPDGLGGRQVRVTARPAPSAGDEAVMISFETLGQEETASPPTGEETPGQEAVIEQFEKELQATREDLRSTVEELETSNEESMSINEELQSANEELEATTEELRSLNEELTTVNAQLREKVEQLEHAHDDLNNFFSSTKIATVFLDEELCIKRFTPAAEQLLGIGHADTGRCISDIARQLLQEDLGSEARWVLENLSPRSHELYTSEGRWITRQILPYRTESRRIEGVVVTFGDVTELKSATERLALRERQQRVIARLGLHGLRETDLEGFMAQAVREVQQTLNTDYCELLELQPGDERLLLRAGIGWHPGLVGSSHVGGGPDSQAGYTLRSTEAVIVADLRVEKRFSGPSLFIDHEVVSGLSCVVRDGDHVYGVLGAHTRDRRSFSLEDTNFLQAVAGVIASTVGRAQTRQRLALELGVAQGLAESTGSEAAVGQVLERLTGELHAKVGEFWWQSEEGGVLTCRRLFVKPPGDEDRVAGLLARTFRSGEGLVGTVYQERAARWCTDLGDPRLFLRRESAHALGLVSGFGFPVLVHNEVVGVVTLYSSERMFADEIFLRSLETIGRSIGEFLLRVDVEERVQRLAAITQSSHDAIISYDFDGRITEWLPGAERMFGYSADEMVGNSIERIVPQELREDVWETNARLSNGDIVEPFETVRVHQDGRRVDVSVRTSAVENKAGRIIGITSTDRDITRQKDTERRLREADRQKDEFLAMLGHELRNPVAAIQNASEALALSGVEDPGLLRTQKILGRQAAHMVRLLDGLLDISRIIRGKIRIEPAVVDFAAVCREVGADVERRMSGRALDIRMALPEEPVWVEADPVRLAQIVDNLLSNAVRYTSDEDWVSLRLHQEGEMTRLDVLDTGIGIEEELLPHVFEIFRQSEQTHDRSDGGLGVGLALVKSLTELHGGTVEAQSAGRHQGSLFVVRLPTTDRRPSPAAPPRRPASEPRRILIIEDNEDAANALRDLLELSGYEVEVASDGPSGLALAREARPDVVLCDLGLPNGVSGFDVARELRSDSRFDQALLIAVSGYARPEDKRLGAEVGFDGHITKPLEVGSIARLLAELGVNSE